MKFIAKIHVSVYRQSLQSQIDDYNCNDDNNRDDEITVMMITIVMMIITVTDDTKCKKKIYNKLQTS